MGRSTHHHSSGLLKSGTYVPPYRAATKDVRCLVKEEGDFRCDVDGTDDVDIARFRERGLGKIFG